MVGRDRVRSGGPVPCALCLTTLQIVTLFFVLVPLLKTTTFDADPTQNSRNSPLWRRRHDPKQRCVDCGCSFPCRVCVVWQLVCGFVCCPAASAARYFIFFAGLSVLALLFALLSSFASSLFRLCPQTFLPEEGWLSVACATQVYRWMPSPPCVSAHMVKDWSTSSFLQHTDILVVSFHHRPATATP